VCLLQCMTQQPLHPNLHIRYTTTDLYISQYADDPATQQSEAYSAHACMQIQTPAATNIPTHHMYTNLRNPPFMLSGAWPCTNQTHSQPASPTAMDRTQNHLYSRHPAACFTSAFHALLARATPLRRTRHITTVLHTLPSCLTPAGVELHSSPHTMSSCHEHFRPRTSNHGGRELGISLPELHTKLAMNSAVHTPQTSHHGGYELCTCHP
jgi:hypothetical protein